MADIDLVCNDRRMSSDTRERRIGKQTVLTESESNDLDGLVASRRERLARPALDQVEGIEEDGSSRPGRERVLKRGTEGRQSRCRAVSSVPSDLTRKRRETDLKVDHEIHSSTLSLCSESHGA